MSLIVLIEDDSGVRMVLERMLVAAGHEVVPLPDGDKAVQVVEHERPALVITDLIMPGREGMATIEELRRRWPDLPILAISGGGRLSAQDLLPVARGLGANATLSKPISTQRLQSVVAELLGE